MAGHSGYPWGRPAWGRSPPLTMGCWTGVRLMMEGWYLSSSLDQTFWSNKGSMQYSPSSSRHLAGHLLAAAQTCACSATPGRAYSITWSCLNGPLQEETFGIIPFVWDLYNSCWRGFWHAGHIPRHQKGWRSDHIQSVLHTGWTPVGHFRFWHGAGCWHWEN